MTRRRTPLARAAALLLLLLHAVTAWAVPVADARAEAVALTAVSHVEAPGGSDSCPAAHDHLACALCRAMSQPPAAPPAVAVLVAAPAAVAERPPVSTVHAPGAAPRAPPGARAPPMA